MKKRTFRVSGDCTKSLQLLGIYTQLWSLLKYIGSTGFIQGLVEEHTCEVKDQRFLANLQIRLQTLQQNPVLIQIEVSLSMYLLNKLLIESEGLLENLVKCAIPEVEADSSVDGKVFPLVYIGHFKDDLFHRVKSDQ